MASRSKDRQSRSSNRKLTLQGEVTVAGLEDFCGRAAAALETSKDVLTLDCHDLTYIDAAGLQALAALHNEAQQRNVRLTFDGVADAVLADAKLLGMSTVFSAPPSIEVGR